MTQPASDETVLAPFDGRVLKSSGRAYRVFMVDGIITSTCLLSGPVARQVDRIIQPVVMTTGSHHTCVPIPVPGLARGPPPKRDSLSIDDALVATAKMA